MLNTIKAWVRKLLSLRVVVRFAVEEPNAPALVPYVEDAGAWVDQALADSDALALEGPVYLALGLEDVPAARAVREWCEQVPTIDVYQFFTLTDLLMWVVSDVMVQSDAPAFEQVLGMIDAMQAEVEKDEDRAFYDAARALVNALAMDCTAPTQSTLGAICSIQK